MWLYLSCMDTQYQGCIQGGGGRLGFPLPPPPPPSDFQYYVYSTNNMITYTSKKTSFVIIANLGSRQEIIHEKPTKPARFPQLLSASQIEQKCKPSIPKNTQVNTSWAVSVLDQWVAHRNSQAHSVDEWCPDNLLIIAHPTDKVDYWLAAFILEARRKDGQYYPPNTVKNIPAEGKLRCTQCT